MMDHHRSFRFIKKSFFSLIGVLALTLFNSGCCRRTALTSAQSLIDYYPQQEQLLSRPDYTVLYSSLNRAPRWVIERLRAGTDWVSLAEGSWQTDSDILAPSQTSLEDYSGYTIAPAACGKNDASFFLLSNALAQPTGNGTWDSLTHYLFAQAKALTEGELIVVSGAAFLPEAGAIHCPVLGPDQVPLPTHCFRVLLTVDNHNQAMQCEAFLVPNKMSELPLENCKIKMEDLENQINLTFPEAYRKVAEPNLLVLPSFDVGTEE